MKKIFRTTKRLISKIGLPPGTPVYMGEREREKIKISVIDYDPQNVTQKEISQIKECCSYQDKETVTWINIDGIHEAEVIKHIGKDFNLHPLTMEDIMNPGQRPKVEQFDHYIFIVLKMLSYEEEEKKVTEEQVSLILGKNYVLSFQEKEGDVFNPVRERIHHDLGRIRKSGSDYLAYSLTDVVVDHYFLILEKLGDKVEHLEESLTGGQDDKMLQQIHSLKREMILLRRSVWPLREMINSLERLESSLIQKETLRFFRDVYDHTIQVIDTIETYRDMIFSLHDTYLSTISNRMNEVMKVLTIIATIFIPLTFIAGIYGMNFELMPELKWPFGYFAVLGVMALVALVMVIYFKKKKWL
ncbi:MAG: magnesium/cobalt transporter CorA [Candidatus Aminicenantes bacterium]|nr:magnesium/cobalt transporter CorA [Candidatus Aminicenantes bacterium]